MAQAEQSSLASIPATQTSLTISFSHVLLEPLLCVVPLGRMSRQEFERRCSTALGTMNCEYGLKSRARSSEEGSIEVAYDEVMVIPPKSLRVRDLREVRERLKVWAAGLPTPSEDVGKTCDPER